MGVTMQDTEQLPVDSVETVSPEDTRHEAHHHARPRLIWGIAALVLVGAGVVVWSKWGEEIKAACTGDNGACTVELEDVPEDRVQFEQPDFPVQPNTTN